MFKRIGYAALGLVLLAVGAIAANNLTISTGTSFIPTGPALFMGSDFNTMLTAINTLRNQADGTTTGVYTGTFNGVLGGTTPAAATTTTLTSSGVHTPTGGIAAAGGFSASPRNVSIGNLVPAVSTDFTNRTPTITEVYIGEVFVPANMTITGVAVFDGSASSGGGNVKMGLANSAGAVVATSASTAGGSNDAYALVPFTAPYAAVGPATYYILSIYDTATAGFFNAPPLGSFGCAIQTGQVYATGFTTITAPTTFTANACNVASLY